MFELHPISLEREGLAAALRAYFTETIDPAHVEWNVDASLNQEPSRPVQSLAYRLTREAVLNAIKHAGPKRVRVAIVERNRGVAAVITDDGRGFDPDAVMETPGHMGLSTNTALATAAGGWWKVLSHPRTGTMVEFWLPDQGLTPVPAYEVVA
jgi:signal transduction histidine kinase